MFTKVDEQTIKISLESDCAVSVQPCDLERPKCDFACGSKTHTDSVKLEDREAQHRSIALLGTSHFEAKNTFLRNSGSFYLMNQNNPSVRRILADKRELDSHPSARYSAAPLDDNLFEWHFTIRGPVGSDFEEGLYHGRILLPSDYPHKPPHFVFMNQNGRFEVGTKVCLSISGHHEETWQPAWGVRTMLEAIISFLPTPGEGAIGALDWTSAERRNLARESHGFACAACGPLSEIIMAPLGGAASADADSAASASIKVGGGGGGEGGGANVPAAVPGAERGSETVTPSKEGGTHDASFESNLRSEGPGRAASSSSSLSSPPPSSPNHSPSHIHSLSHSPSHTGKSGSSDNSRTPPSRSAALALRLDTADLSGDPPCSGSTPLHMNLPLTPAPPARGAAAARLGTNTDLGTHMAAAAAAAAAHPNNSDAAPSPSPSPSSSPAHRESVVRPGSSGNGNSSSSGNGVVAVSSETMQRMRSISESLQHPAVAAAIAAADSRDVGAGAGMDVGSSSSGLGEAAGLGLASESEADLPTARLVSGGASASGARASIVSVTATATATATADPQAAADDELSLAHAQTLEAAGTFDLPPLPKHDDELDAVLFGALVVLGAVSFLLLSSLLARAVEEGEGAVRILPSP